MGAWERAAAISFRLDLQVPRNRNRPRTHTCRTLQEGIIKAILRRKEAAATSDEVKPSFQPGSVQTAFAT